MNIAEINLENARELLIEESFKRPVLIDFWADWCGPCKSLMPILEKLAHEYDGAFLLAKVNADEMQMISSQFGVRSLPTVMLMQDGQPVDGFAGALPEVQVRELLDKYLPKPWEKFVSAAQGFMAEGDFTAALPLLRQAYDDTQQSAAIGYLIAECHLASNRIDNAEAVLDQIKPADQNEVYEELRAQIALKKQEAKSPELIALEQAFEQQPDDLDVTFALARQYHAEQTYRPALELLMQVLRKDKGFAEGEVRKLFTDTLATLGKGDPLAIEFQRKLFTLLY